MSPYIAPEGSVVVSVVGEDRVRARFADIASRTRASAELLVATLAEQLADAARAAAPRGRSGALARSIKALKTRPNNKTGRLARTGLHTDDTIRWVVRPRLSTRGRLTDYAYNVEFGQLPRSRGVRSYSRRYDVMNIQAVRYLKRGGARPGRVIARGVQMVSAYRSMQTMKARPFLGPTFERMRPQIEATLAKGMATIVSRTAGGLDTAGTGRGGKGVKP